MPGVSHALTLSVLITAQVSFLQKNQLREVGRLACLTATPGLNPTPSDPCSPALAPPSKRRSQSSLEVGATSSFLFLEVCLGTWQGAGVQ